MDKNKKTPFNRIKFKRRIGLVIYDIASVIAASYLAILMRYEFHIGEVPPHFLAPVEQFLPVNVLLTVLLFFAFRLYHRLWADAGENELQNLVVACVLSGVVNGVGLQFLKIHTIAVPQSYYFLYTFLLITFIFISRFSYRYFRSMKHRQENKDNAIAVMIIGAGEAGNTIIKELTNSNYSTMSIRCIIDDDPNKWGRYIQGIRVVGGRDKIAESVDLYGIDEIIIAIPSASREQISSLLEICKETNCKLKQLPGVYQLVNGEVNVSKLREVEIEDLLGREPIQVDINSILGYVSGKVVLVTGGGGSIGSEL